MLFKEYPLLLFSLHYIMALVLSLHPLTHRCLPAGTPAVYPGLTHALGPQLVLVLVSLPPYLLWSEAHPLLAPAQPPLPNPCAHPLVSLHLRPLL
jgi:hypothetical protein